METILNKESRAAIELMVADGIIAKDTAERYFPELKESEDERIRKNLISCISTLKHPLFSERERREFIAWLEKHGKQKPVISNDALREGIAHFGITQYQIDNWLKKCVDVEKQGGQKPADKPKKCMYSKDDYTDEDRLVLCDGCDEICELKQKTAWSEEDNSYIHSIVAFLGECKGYNPTDINIRKVNSDIAWLKDLKERVQPQQKQEWSKEDEQMFNTIANSLDRGRVERVWHTTIEKVFNWLKSLKERYTWKPSDEQMKALGDINVTGCLTYAGQGQELINLYNDLKKLKK